MYSAYRGAGPEQDYHRIGQFAMPFWTMAPSEPMDHIHARAWVPIDDHHSMLVVISGPRSTFTRDKHGQLLPGAGVHIRYLPNTTDWLGRWRIEENIRNDHLISRQVQRSDSYSGIEGIPIQDQAITESMGPIVDRMKEHLGTSDRMITLTRRKLMRTAVALRDQGLVPEEVEAVERYRYVRSGFALLPQGADWLGYYNSRRLYWSNGAAVPIERPKRTVARTPEGVA
jgi:hypothetical protein